MPEGGGGGRAGEGQGWRSWQEVVVMVSYVFPDGFSVFWECSEIRCVGYGME